MQVHMHMVRMVVVACVIVWVPETKNARADRAAGRSRFSSLFFVAASGGK